MSVRVYALARHAISARVNRSKASASVASIPCVPIRMASSSSAVISVIRAVGLSISIRHLPAVHHVFTVKVPAGWRIEACGWKGKTVGRTGCHKDQALVLVNYGGATGGEILGFSRALQRSVKEKFGIELSPEVSIIESIPFR